MSLTDEELVNIAHTTAKNVTARRDIADMVKDAFTYRFEWSQVCTKADLGVLTPFTFSAVFLPGGIF